MPPSVLKFAKLAAPRPFGTLTIADILSGSFTRILQKHRIIELSGYPLCKTRRLHNARDFVTNRSVKRRILAKIACKTPVFYVFRMLGSGLGGARVDTEKVRS